MDCFREMAQRDVSMDTEKKKIMIKLKVKVDGDS